MPTSFHQFTIGVDAVKNVPMVGPAGDGTRYVLQWHYDDRSQGSTAEMDPVKDEVTFNLSAQFSVEHQGVITKLLQLNVVAVRPQGERELAGVLMIDLNAHVPKLPSKSSKQRATLQLSRCPTPKPLLIRLSIACVPTTAASVRLLKKTAVPSATTGPAAAAPVPSGRDRASSSARAQSPAAAGGANLDATGLSPIPADPQTRERSQSAVVVPSDVQEQLNRLRATVTTLSSANEQLRDENKMLRTGANRAREEPDYTYTVDRGDAGAKFDTTTNTRGRSMSQRSARGNSVPSAALAAANTVAAFEAEEHAAQLQTEVRTLEAEIAILQKGLQSAREQIRGTSEREEHLKTEIATLKRTNRALEDELHRAEDEQKNTNQKYQAALGLGMPEGSDALTELAGTREMLLASQQMNRDLKSLLETAEKAAKGSEEKVLEQKQKYSDLEHKLSQVQRQYQQREQAAVVRADAAEAKLVALNNTQKQLHDYCNMAKDRCRQLAVALEKERTISSQRAKKVEDFKAILKAHVLLEEQQHP